MIVTEKGGNNMEMLKCKTTVLLIIMVLSVAFIGGMDNAKYEDNVSDQTINSIVNA